MNEMSYISLFFMSVALIFSSLNVLRMAQTIKRKEKHIDDLMVIISDWEKIDEMNKSAITTLLALVKQ